jgi:hypothetical protein
MAKVARKSFAGRYAYAALPGALSALYWNNYGQSGND